jgi:acyl transferase domain-containing protein/NADPH:quinone reductase-like Zn-dependent oxidoreductase/SAM-dependent methyltransferase
MILKPLHLALADGDPIRAVIRNTYSNQDGRTAGITTPSQEAQMDMITGAYKLANLSMADTAYCETHGTGTPVGDPIEAGAIAATIGKGREGQGPLIIGSAKSNIGHLESCANLAALIKTIMMLEHAQIVPNFDFRNPNPRIPLDKINIRVSTKLLPFPAASGKSFRRASVNAFGYGGTNGHAIIDDAEGYLRNHGLADHLSQVPSANYAQVNGIQTNGNHSETPKNSRVFFFSGKTSRALQARKQDIATYLENAASRNDVVLGDMAYTLNCRRSHLLHRDFVVASSYQDFVDALGRSSTTSQAANPPETSTMAFCFTGQGAQWAGMGQELIDVYPVFRQTIERCEELLREYGAAWSLMTEMRKAQDLSRVNEAELSQPLCTALQIAVFELLATWDIHPQAVFGHSSGEIAAAYASNALSLKDAMKASYYRGFWCSKMKKVVPECKGAMLAVGLSEEAAALYIGDVPVEAGKVVIACVNSPSSVTISGDAEAIDHLEVLLTNARVFARKLRVDTAYHSHHMEKVADSYRSALTDVKPRPWFKAKFFSSVTGTFLDSPSTLNGDYWVTNMVSQVKFLPAVQSFANDLATSEKGHFSNMIVEIGPHSVLSGPLRDILKSPSTPKVTSVYLSSILRKKNGVESLLSLAGNAFARGSVLNYNAINPDSGSKPRVLVDLPKYPWDHSTTYWYESRISSDYRLRTLPKHPLLGAPSMDWNPLKPSWRNIIRMAELPWVKSHGIQSEIIYPAGGFLAAVLQACSEYNLIKAPNRKIGQFVFKDVDIMKALVVPEGPDGVEIKTELEPLFRPQDDSSSRFKFTIHSCTADKVWSQNCTGFARIVYGLETSSQEDDATDEIREFDEVERELPTWVRRTRSTLYEGLRGLGYFYEAPFQGIEEVFTEPNRSLAKILVPDTSEFMPRGYELPIIAHPATIDSFLQTPLCALFEADALLTTMVPTHVGSLTISGDMLHVPGDRLSVLAHAFPQGPRKCHVRFRVRSGDGKGRELVICKGLQYSSLGKARDSVQQQKFGSLCNRFVTQPGTMILTGDAFRRLTTDKTAVPIEASIRAETFQRASISYIKHAVNILGNWKPDGDTPWYKVKLFEWLKSHREEGQKPLNGFAGTKIPNGVNGSTGHDQAGLNGSIDHDQSGLNGSTDHDQSGLNGSTDHDQSGLNGSTDHDQSGLNGSTDHDQSSQNVSTGTRILNGINGSASHPQAKNLSTLGATGELITLIGPHLASIIQGTQDPLQLMTRDGILAKVFSEPDLQKCYSVMQRYLSTLTYEKTDLKVLEYGNFVGRPCKPVLEALDGSCTVYDFVSSQSAFLLDEMGIGDTGSIPVNFKKLALEDPIEHGYTEGSYDLVIATNTLHLAKSIRTALRNIRRLLKPGGILLVVDITNPKLYVNMLFGTLAGWWGAEEEYRHENPTLNLQQWDAALKEAQFSGSELSTEDTGPYGVIATHATWLPPKDEPKLTVALVAKTDDFEPNLVESIRKLAGLDVHTRKISDIRVESGVVVIFDDGPVSVLEGVTSADFAAIKTLISAADGIAWITRRQSAKSLLPSQGSMVAGLARVVRSENPNLPFVTVEMDSDETTYENRRATVAVAIVQHVRGMTQGQRSGEEDTEFFEKDGILCVTRILNHDRASLYASKVVVETQPQLGQFSNSKHLKELDVLAPGSVGSICWVDRGLRIPSPKPDELVIEAKAFGINSMDLSIALGRFGSASDMSGAFSGIVRVVGTDCQDEFQLGDVVCGWTATGFVSHPVLKASAVRKTALPFATAAAISVAYPTITYSLLHLARLQKGESILIRNATGPLGDIAIQLAQHLGANILLAFDSSFHGEITGRKFGIPENRIVSGDVVGAVNALTSGRGANVLVNFTASDDVFACMAPFGRVLDLSLPEEGQRSIPSDFRSYEKSLSFFSVDMTTVLKHRPDLYGKYLDEALGLVTQGVLDVDAKEHSLEDMTPVFRLMQKGDVGNHVFVVESEMQVPVRYTTNVFKGKLLLINRSPLNSCLL